MRSVLAKLTVNYWETDKKDPATNDNVHKWNNIIRTGSNQGMNNY